MLPTPGPPTFTFRGKLLVRAHGFAYLHEITCPNGHQLKMQSFRISEDGVAWCQHRAAAGQSECGAVLWLLYVPGRGRKRSFYVADIELREHDLWEQHRAGVDDILDYLGASFPIRPLRAA